MKKIVSVFALLLFVTQFSAQNINWVGLEEAVELQKKNPKKIMIDVYTEWCGPCKMLDKNTFQNKDVADYVNKYYYAVKFNAEGNEDIDFKGNSFKNPGYKADNAKRRNTQHQLATYYSITSYPTILILDEKAEFLSPVIGYKTPQQLELFLKLFKDKEYVDIKTQEEFSAYTKTFKPEFSN